MKVHKLRRGDRFLIEVEMVNPSYSNANTCVAARTGASSHQSFFLSRDCEVHSLLKHEIVIGDRFKHNLLIAEFIVINVFTSKGAKYYTLDYNEPGHKPFVYSEEDIENYTTRIEQ